MKKLLLILIVFTIVSCCNTINAQATQIAIDAKDKVLDEIGLVAEEYVTESNVEKLVDKYTDKIGAAFEALSQKLEQPVEYVWNAFVKVNFAKGIVQLLFLLCFIISVFIVLRLLKLLKDDDNNEVLIGAFVIAALICAFSLIATFCTITEAIPRLIAPEYYALKEVFELFK